MAGTNLCWTTAIINTSANIWLLYHLFKHHPWCYNEVETWRYLVWPSAVIVTTHHSLMLWAHPVFLLLQQSDSGSYCLLIPSARAHAGYQCTKVLPGILYTGLGWSSWWNCWQSGILLDSSSTQVARRMWDTELHSTVQHWLSRSGNVREDGYLYKAKTGWFKTVMSLHRTFVLFKIN